MPATQGQTPASASRRAARALRGALARSPDPYAGSNLDLVRRLGAVMLGFTFALAAALLPLAHPTDHVGITGWAVASAALAVLAGGGVRLAELREVRPHEGLAWCYAAPGAVTGLGWLTGGGGRAHS